MPAAVAERVEGFIGREWVFGTVADWLARGGGKWLTITGDPGAGKTAFMARLVQMARGEIDAVEGCPQPRIHAAHFCRREEFDSIDPVQVITHIGNQLEANVPGYSDQLVAGQDGGVRIEAKQRIHSMTGGMAAVINELTLGDRNPRRAWAQVVRRPLSSLYEGGKLSEAVVVLLDGLDEAVEGTSGYDLARLLYDERYESMPGLRLLLATRPGDAADRAQVTARGPVIDLVVSQPVGVDDLAAYTAARFAGLSAPSGPLLAARVAAASQGNFLYAKHVVREVLAADPVPVNLDQRHLPAGLTGTYRDFLNRHIAADPDAWRKAYRPVLGAIAQSRGAGLTCDQLTAITGGAQLTVDLTVDDVLKDCASYLRLTRPGGSFQLYHQSFGDYLREPGDHNINPAEASRQIVNMLARHRPDWDDSTDTYAIRYLLDHLAEVLVPTGGPSREQMLQIAEQTAANPGFLCAAIVQNGVSHLLGQLARLDGVPDLPAQVTEVYRVLGRQAQLLLGLETDARPGFLLQQLAFQAHAIGARALGDRLNDYADERSLAGLRTRWVNPGMSSSRHLHTLRCNSFAWQAVTITPDGTRAILASRDSDTAQVCDLATGAVLGTLPGCKELWTAAVTPDGNWVVAADMHGAAGVWDLNTGREVFALSRRSALSGGGEWVKSVAITPDGTRAITGGSGGVVRVWDLDDGTQLATLHVATNNDDDGWVEVTAIAVIAEGRRVVTLCKDDSVGVWDLRTGRLLHNLSGLQHDVHTLATAPDGKTAVTSSLDGTARVWNLETGTELHTLRGHRSTLTAVTITDDGAQAITTALGGEDACVWDLHTGELLHKLPSEHGTVWSVAITADGTRTITGCADGSVTVWDLTTGQLEYTLTGHQGLPVRAVAVTRDGSRAVTCCVDGVARVWALTAESHSDIPPGHTGYVTDLAVTPDGRYAITGSADGSARVWDVRTGQPSLVLSHGNDVDQVAITPDGTRAVTVNSTVARVWDLTNGRQLRRMRVSRFVIMVTTITADGTRVLFGLQSGGTGLWDLRTKPTRRFQVLSGNQHRVYAMTTTPDGVWAVTGSGDGAVRVWDLAAGRALHVLSGHHTEIIAVAITPDGSRALTGSRDGAVRIWELATGHRLDATTGQWDHLDDLAIAPDGTRAVTGSRWAKDDAVHLWDLTGRCKQVCTLLMKNGVTHVAISARPREAVIATANDGMVACFQPGSLQRPGGRGTSAAPESAPRL